MAETTSIEWCDHTFNGWIGCQKISPGCENCYACVDTFTRTQRAINRELWGPAATAERHVTSESNWRKPLAWNRDAHDWPDECVRCGRRLNAAIQLETTLGCFGCGGREFVKSRPRVFAFSEGDVFEKFDGLMTTMRSLPYWWCHGSLSSSPIPSTGLPEGCRLATMDDFRDRLFQLIVDTPNLDLLLLTKRPENAKKMMASLTISPPNLWVGASIENQKYANERIPQLLEIPAAVRFLSIEPLLGPIDLTSIRWQLPDSIGVVQGSVLGNADGRGFSPRGAQGQGINWVIVGGESGPNARPCDLAWIRSIVEQCLSADVPCFVKQLGSFPIGDWRGNSRPFRVVSWRLNDRKGGDPSEWPEDLHVREFPRRQPA